MGVIHFIKYSFGTNITNEIPDEQLEYLASFFSSYFGSQYIISNSSLAKEHKTIPISYKNISNQTDILSRKLIEYLLDDGVIDDEKKIINPNDLIVIDIKSNIRDTTLLYLSSEIDSILKKDIDCASPRFAIIVDNLPAIQESFISIFSHIQTGKVVLVDKKKRFKYKEEPIKVNREFSFNQLSKSSLDKTKFKLIRKIGHYGRYKDDEKIACSQFFYDGRDCVEDIRNILFDKIENLLEKKSFNHQ
jgi:hypothetical protein